MNPFESLSEKQREIVFEKSGMFVVRACPGSGKTYSVAARLAHQIHNNQLPHKGIATLSFTNVAWKEIENYLKNIFGIYTPLSYPHFLGTLDSFINKYIFLPFGHLALECNERPTLVGEPHGTWNGYNYWDGLFDNITFNKQGEYIAINPRKIRSGWERRKELKKAKERILKNGFANQSDANYFSLKLIQQYPSIARSLVQRFPWFILDEAQDTSSIQLEILDVLTSSGLENLMLVGDVDQAIFEWNEARPDLLNKKFREWEENSLVLNENRRSSRAICDFSYKISSLRSSSTPVNESVKDFSYTPNFCIYEESYLDKTIHSFLDTCKSHDIEITPDNVAVVCRSKTLLRSIVGSDEVASPWNGDKLYVKDIVFGKYLIDKKYFRKGYKKLERGLFKAVYHTNFCSRENIKELIARVGFVQWRSELFKIASSLPHTNEITIGDWIDQSMEFFKGEEMAVELPIKPSKGDTLVDDLFRLHGGSETDYRLGTVHSVKGETFDALLLFLKQSGGQGKHYRTLLEQRCTTSNSEELRIVYVAITRPRKVLTVAVPDRKNFYAWRGRMHQQSLF